jgi:hypothetical protein
VVVGGGLAILGTFGAAIAQGIGFLGTMIRVVGGVARAAVGLWRIVVMVGQFLAWWGRIVWMLISALSVLNPVVLTVVAVVAVLAAAAFLVWKNWATLGPFFSKLWEGIKSKLASLVPWLLGLGPKLYEAGATIAGMIGKGITSKIDDVKKAMGKLTEGARRFLPFSPAKEGAFRDLHRVKIVETIAQAVKPGPLRQAMAVTTAAAIAAVPGPALAAAPARGGAGPVVVQFHIHVHGGNGQQAANDALDTLKRREPEVVQWLEGALARAGRGRFQPRR